MLGIGRSVGPGSMTRVVQVAQTCYGHFRLEALHCGSRVHLIVLRPGREEGQGHIPGCLPAGPAPGDLTHGCLPTRHSRLYHCRTDAGCCRAEEAQMEASGDRTINRVGGSLTCSDLCHLRSLGWPRAHGRK